MRTISCVFVEECMSLCVFLRGGEGGGGYLS